MTIQTTLIASVALSVFMLSPVEAATWNAISLGTSPDRATAEYKYSAASFIDGQYVPYDPARGPTSFVLSDNPNSSATPTVLGEQRNTITFTGLFPGTEIRPPRVDTFYKTISLDSLWFEGTQAEYDCDVNLSCDPRSPKLVWNGVIGTLFGPFYDVPYIQNADGTFTAAFDATDHPETYYSFGNTRLYFTFAAQVPEPAPAAMLAVGVAILFGLRRRRFLNNLTQSQSSL